MCTLLRGDPQARREGLLRAVVRNTAQRAPRPPPTTWQLGGAGRQEVWKQIRKNRVFIHECVYKEGKKNECQLHDETQTLSA